MRLTIEMTLDNADFEDDPIGTALKLINRVLPRINPTHRDYENVFDSNGNTVGRIELIERRSK
jgi:hypothetical protein